MTVWTLHSIRSVQWAGSPALSMRYGWRLPVVTMQGDRVASRATAAIVGALGHTEWAARTEAEYIDRVVSLARDVEQRKALRHAQRERMALSPLCDAKGLAASMEDAYVEMFERWLQRQNGRRSIAS